MNFIYVSQYGTEGRREEGKKMKTKRYKNG
jgi:hypothetical protein